MRKKTKSQLESVISNTENIPQVVKSLSKYPDLFSWEPKDEEIYFCYDPELCKVVTRYEEYYGIHRDTNISKFKIKQGHYQKRMPEICQHINYFINFYDKENMELYNSVFVMKNLIDRKPFISQKDFRKLILNRVVTDSIIEKLIQMAFDIYEENTVETSDTTRYVSTPKITPSQAKLILAISFCIRIIIPLCLHYVNVNDTFKSKTAYIPFFDKLIMKIIAKFEEGPIKVFKTLCRFVEYRVDKYYSQHYLMWVKKKQLYGVTRSTYLDEVIHEVIIVKGLYKLDYRRSVVSFIDGVIFKHHINFKRENFKTKPVEIDQYDVNSDNDNYLSHAEAIEMQNYKVDASNAMFTSVNIRQVLKAIENNFRIPISKEELDFYQQNMKINYVTEGFVHDFYSAIFHDTNANLQLSEYDTIKLVVILKKYLQLMGMHLLPQLCTAKVRGKFKENLIKNAKFTEIATTSNKHKEIVNPKFKYIDELFPGEMLNLKNLSIYINSEFEFVDFDENINGFICNDMDVAMLADEYDTFLSII